MRTISRHSYVLFFVPLTLASLPLAGGAQEPPADPGGTQDAPATRKVSLERAVADALARNGDLRAAGARTDAARARVRRASSFLYPALGLEAGGVRSDDPVAVFGTKLRQERFAEADFGLDALNRPAPITDWTAGGGVRWRILDPSAWSGREAARLGARASELELERHRQATVYRTRVLYLRALAADARVGAAREALEAARASGDAVRRRREQGVLTEADVLEADAETAGARARLMEALSGRFEARSRLGVHAGWSADTLPVPSDDLLLEGPPGAGTRTADAGPPEVPADRADIRALERGVEAAAARASQASRSRLPTVETFGRLSTHAADLGGARSANWTLGLRLELPVFTGFDREGSLDEARAARRAAEAEHTQRLREARAHAREARRALEAARDRAEAAAAAAGAAREGRRLVRRRFEQGLTTTDRLLQADARTAEMELRAVEARSALRIADARLDFVLGVTPTDR